MSTVLVINGGSSSIKFAVYPAAGGLERLLSGQIDRIGLPGSRLTITDGATAQSRQQDLPSADPHAAGASLLAWLTAQAECAQIVGIGHRIVHGLHHTEPTVITPALIDDLRQIIPCDPEHLPLALDLIGLVADRLPGVPQIACFDTAFHRGMPRVATLFALPRRFEALGIQRYGFHGLSYAYQMQELARLGDPAATRGRVILAHLGNGASLAAVRDGTGIDTSMGFTPAGGLPMSTRSGDIDPGIIAYLMAHQAMTGDQIHHLVNHESGLLGISETSGDMRDLEAAAPTDVRAAEAVSCFCYQVSKGIGAFAATLGGVDTLTFAGGIGEHSPAIRARICAPLGFCGIALDATRNAKDAAVISADWAGTSVRVIRTDEEVMIARAMRLLLESSQLLGHLS